MRILIPLALLALSACATTSTPAIDVKTVEVDKPVPVSCVKAADIPPEPAKIGKLGPGKDARQAADLLGAVDLELRSWGHKLVAIIGACSK